MSTPPPPADLPARLRAALTGAMSARDTIAAAAIRAALGAIGNAEAVPTAAGPPPTSTAVSSEHIAGAAAGLGAAEAERRALTEADIAAIVAAEIADRRSAAEQYDRIGRLERSARLRQEAGVLARLLASPLSDLALPPDACELPAESGS